MVDILPISADQLNDYRRLGYQGNERIWSRPGIEKSMEQHLAGKHGGVLYVVDAQRPALSKIGASDPQPGDLVYLTIDKNMQQIAQQALTGYNGAIVVMEINTGKVLAMASSPEYDQNLFDPSNANSQYLLSDLLSRTDQPLLIVPRRADILFGSVFKIPAMAAVLESGLYTPQTTYDCEYHFTELNGITLNDWTWDFCQNALKAGKQCDTTSTKPSGVITLQQGLMRSCDPYFWHISVDLFNNNRAADITNMARAFRLADPPGLVPSRSLGKYFRADYAVAGDQSSDWSGRCAGDTASGGALRRGCWQWRDALHPAIDPGDSICGWQVRL